MELAWLLVVPAYLLGTFPTAILVGRHEGRDPTQEGSGQPGRVQHLPHDGPPGRRHRAARRRRQGRARRGVAAWPPATEAVGVACGLAAVLGHVYPVTRRFRGGKGVATGAGMALVLLPGRDARARGRVGGGREGVRRRVGGLGGGGRRLPVGAWLVGRPTGEVAAFAACGVLVVIRHRDNLDRLRRGEERSLTKDRSD